MRKNLPGLRRLVDSTGLVTKGERLWFLAALALLLADVEAVVFSQNFIAGYRSPALMAVCAVAAVPACLFALWVCARLRLAKVQRAPSRGRTAAVALAFFVLALAMVLPWLVLNWPGAMSPDTFNQLAQVQSGNYSSWHPVLETWLFLTLPYKLFGTEAAATVAQAVWFACAASYLYSVLYRRGCPWSFMALSWLYIAANPNNGQILTTLWKDPAMSILSLVWFTHLVQIYASGGAWLKRWPNTVAFCLFAFLVNGMRHNAVLLVAPVFLILLLFFKHLRARLTICSASVLAAALLFNGPVLQLAQVNIADNYVVETMGAPMTILCNVYTKDPSALTADARAFMADLATPEEWANNYRTGSFNSIKWNNSQSLESKVNSQERSVLLRYTLQASLARPGLAFDAFAKLTHMVWGLDGARSWSLAPTLEKDTQGDFLPVEPPLRQALSEYGTLCSESILKYLFQYLGVVNLVLLLLEAARLGRGRLSRSFLVLAPMTYNFGTMLLLSGPDFRFFHFNFLIIVPLIFLLLFPLPEQEQTARQPLP